jgi:ribonuclease BN (tRNA processing enzyme)
LWPHTNPTQAAELAARARVKKLVLFHFDASIYTTMADRKQAEKEARGIFKKTTVARDGLVLNL